ncbi:MAG: hypothetical protein L6R39_007328, partial [Caloplaca ligustica]
EWLGMIDEAYFSMSGSSDEESDPHDESSSLDGGGEEKDAHMGGVEEGREIVNGVDVGEVRDMLRHWSESTGIGVEKLCFTSFREVKSDVGKTANGNGGQQDRVVELAGKIGGGW